jgi:DNA-binding response OmpR family regulator
MHSGRSAISATPELLARIRAILRGWEAARAASAWKPRQVRYTFGGWSLDGRLRRLTSPSGLPVALSKAQYALLVAFLVSPQRPLTRLDLMLTTSEHEDCFDRSVDVRVLRLRRKLETAPGAVRSYGPSEVSATRLPCQSSARALGRATPTKWRSKQAQWPSATGRL